MSGCKILLLAANPEGMPHLALDKEIREIRSKIKASEGRYRVELIPRGAVRPADLLQHLLEEQPDVVHFSGHGMSNEIILLGSDDRPKSVGNDAIAYLFQTLKDRIRLVVLNACYSQVQAELISEHIDCVVGMSNAIGDDAAIVFAASFYQALAEGRSIYDAFRQGKLALMLEGIREEHTPKLIYRVGVHPEELVLWAPMKSADTVQPAETDSTSTPNSLAWLVAAIATGITLIALIMVVNPDSDPESSSSDNRSLPQEPATGDDKSHGGSTHGSPQSASAGTDEELKKAIESICSEGGHIGQLLKLVNSEQDRQRARHILKSRLTMPGELSKPFDPAERNEIAIRRANVAGALVALNDGKNWVDVFETNSSSEYPIFLSYFVHNPHRFVANPEVLIAAIDDEKYDPLIRQSFILSLNAFGEAISVVDRELLVPKLINLFSGDADPGVHAACEWLLFKWGRTAEIDRATEQILARSKPLSIPNKRGWYVDRFGQTMVTINGPVAFKTHLPERLQTVRITHDFAIGQKEVTIKQFQEFIRDEGFRRKLTWSEKKIAGTLNEVDTDDAPIGGVDWYTACAFANWLTEQELGELAAKSQRCYVPNDKGKFSIGMNISPEYLKRAGYRLPLEAEWEYSCRAGTESGWSMGDDNDELLAQYANSSNMFARRGVKRVGSLKPNGFGLFDMHGNIWEWCQGSVYRAYKSPDNLSVFNKRVARGGSFSHSAKNVRSDSGANLDASFADNLRGFRVARTRLPSD